MTATNGPMAERLAKLIAARGDTVGVTEVAAVVESLIHTMEGDLSAGRIRVSHELQALVDYIQEAKSEILALSPGEIHDRHIPVATDELDAVVKATEEATNAILDAAEALESLGKELPAEAGERITGIVTKIYEASNFQDITGQRITKVVDTLRYIEDRVRRLAAAVGQDLQRNIAREALAERLSGDAGLLNGPQLESVGNSQEDIDALLESFD